MHKGNDAKAKTVRGYLVALLLELWRDPGYFNGKQVFGNSDWEYDLYRPLVEAELIGGAFDGGGQVIEDVDTQAGDALIAAAIAELGRS